VGGETPRLPFGRWLVINWSLFGFYDSPRKSKESSAGEAKDSVMQCNQYENNLIVRFLVLPALLIQEQ